MQRSKIPQSLDASGISLKFTEISLEKGKYNVADNVVTSLELSYNDIFFLYFIQFYVFFFVFISDKQILMINIMNNYYPTCESFIRMKIAISYMQIFKHMQ